MRHETLVPPRILEHLRAKEGAIRKLQDECAGVIQTLALERDIDLAFPLIAVDCERGVLVWDDGKDEAKEVPDGDSVEERNGEHAGAAIPESIAPA